MILDYAVAHGFIPDAKVVVLRSCDYPTDVAAAVLRCNAIRIAELPGSKENWIVLGADGLSHNGGAQAPRRLKPGFSPPSKPHERFQNGRLGASTPSSRLYPSASASLSGFDPRSTSATSSKRQ